MPAEAHEHRERRPELRQELAAAGRAGARRPRAGATAGRAPRAGRPARRPRPSGRPRGAVDDADGAPVSGRACARAMPTRSPRAPIADGSSTISPFSAWCSASARSSIRLPASTSMSWMSGSPTTKRRAAPTATATFIASWTVLPPGVRIVPSRAIASCIATAAARRPRAVVAVDPAGDRVAREVDDVAAAAVELVDDGVEDAADVGRQLLGAALRAELRRPAPR